MSRKPCRPEEHGGTLCTPSSENPTEATIRSAHALLQAGLIGENERILLSDEGEVYLKIDEDTFGTSDALRMMFELANEQNQKRAKRIVNLEIGIKRLLSQRIQSSVILRLIAWLKNSRIGRT